MRLDALLSRYGYCSRREAPGWIKRHSITFKGKPCSSPTDKVQAEGILLDGEPVEFPDGLYAALYKPEGYTCSHDDGEGDLIYDLLPFQWRNRNPAVSSVGRLDKETSGLLLLTDDGKFIHRMTSPRHHVAKVYEAVTEEDIPTEAVELFASGTLTLNGETRPCAPALLEIREPRRALLTLTEGKYHQVRRMLAAVGAPVLSLCRVSIGSLHLDSLNLKPGGMGSYPSGCAVNHPSAMWIPISEAPIACFPHFEVAAESGDWIVVDKGAPLIVHPSNGKKEPCLLEGVEALLSYEIANGAALSLVNRLDRETSGLTLVAKNKRAARELGRAMQRRLIHKEYLAIVQEWPEWTETACTAPILRQGEVAESRIWVKQAVHPAGKACTTVFRKERTWNTRRGPLALVRCIPETGRMHQIRVHLTHLGHPILGDKIYGPFEHCYLEYIQHGWSRELEEQLVLPRHALHACRLEFPFDEETFTAEAPLPEDMRRLLETGD